MCSIDKSREEIVGYVITEFWQVYKTLLPYTAY